MIRAKRRDKEKQRIPNRRQEYSKVKNIPTGNWNLCVNLHKNRGIGVMKDDFKTFT